MTRMIEKALTERSAIERLARGNFRSSTPPKQVLQSLTVKAVMTSRLYTAFFGRTTDSAGQIYCAQQVQEGHLIFVQGSGRRLSSHLNGNNRAQQSACHLELHGLMQKGQPQGCPFSS